MFVLSLTYLCWVVKDATNIFDNNMGFLLRSPMLIGPPPHLTPQPVWPDWLIYWTSGNLLKPLPTINLPKSSTFLGNFVNVSKSFIFAVKSCLGNFCRLLAIFFWSHCPQHADQPNSVIHPQKVSEFSLLYSYFFARVVKVLAFVASEILVRKKCYINENIKFTLFIFGALGFNATVVGNCWCCYCCCCCCCYCCCWLLLLLLMLLLMMEQISKSIVPKELIVQNGKTLRRWDRWQKDRRKEKKCRSLCPSSWNLISVKSGVDALEGNVL